MTVKLLKDSTVRGPHMMEFVREYAVPLEDDRDYTVSSTSNFRYSYWNGDGNTHNRVLLISCISNVISYKSSIRHLRWSDMRRLEIQAHNKISRDKLLSVSTKFLKKHFMTELLYKFPEATHFILLEASEREKSTDSELSFYPIIDKRSWKRITLGKNWNTGSLIEVFHKRIK